MRIATVHIKQLLTTLLLVCVAFMHAYAQSSDETFGKNRVQYKDFDWKYISTKNFNIYYYQGGERIAYNAGRYIEEDFERIKNVLGFAPYSRVNILIYNSTNDLHQSNIGLQHHAFVGGETALIKSRAEIAFTGSQVEFREEIRQRVAELMIRMMIYGGSLREMLRNSYLISLPDWYIEGAAAYIGSEGMSAASIDAVRTALQSKKPRDPSTLRGDEAVLIGQSLWNFIAIKYGEHSISNLLNLTRLVRNEETALSASLGTNYNKLLRDWEEYYRKQQDPIIDDHEMFDKNERTKKINWKSHTYTDVAVNNSDNKIAYSQNRNGRYKVYVHDAEIGKRKLVNFGGRRIAHQKPHKNIPILGWRSNEELSMLVYQRGKPVMITKNIETKKKEKKYFETFDEVLSYDYSDISDDMVICGVKGGQSDIFIYDYKKDKAVQITRDLYDEQTPRYLPKSGKIVFASNRINDTLRADFGDYERQTNRFNLFVYDSEAKNRVLERLTDNPNISFHQPIPVKGDKLYTIAEEYGYRYLAEINLDNGHASHVTSFTQNILLYDVNLTTDEWYYTGYTKRKQHLYKSDSLSNKTRTAIVVKVQPKEEEKSEEDIEAFLEDLSKLNYDLLRFEGDSTYKPDNPFEKARKEERERMVKIYGPYPYKNYYGADYFVSSLKIDQLRGYGLFMQLGTSEMFGNHRINASVFGLIDIRSSSFHGEYEYLKKRQDYKVRFEQDAIFRFREGLAHRYTGSSVQFTVAHPFTESMRVAFTPFYLQTKYTDYNDVSMPDQTRSYAAYRAEWVFDNTLEHGLNMLEGHRMKVSYTGYNAPGNSEANFGRILVDVRQYHNVFRQMTLALRGAYGQFTGNSKKDFLLGGMDNWIFQQTDGDQGPNSPLGIGYRQNNSDLLFLDYVTSMRGFNYNRRMGDKYLMFNAEMRVPIPRLLTQTPIRSPFWRNFQAIVFYDIAATWSGGSPFGVDNSINTREVQAPDNPFSATVTNYTDPFLRGYGVGLRTMLFGYYVKTDLAWGRENYVTNPRPKLYITLGYDF